MSQVILYQGYTITSCPAQDSMTGQWRFSISISGSRNGSPFSRSYLMSVTYPTEGEADIHGVTFAQSIIDRKAIDYPNFETTAYHSPIAEKSDPAHGVALPALKSRRENVMGDEMYKGYSITLFPSFEHTMWACQYVIEKTGEQMAGFPINVYSSREEAESAALAKAKTLIDQGHLIKASSNDEHC